MFVWTLKTAQVPVSKGFSEAGFLFSNPEITVGFMDARTALPQALMSGPGYGLELIDRVRERSGGKVEVFQGSAYPALRALEREGLVISDDAEQTPDRTGRPRQYYKLTAAGRWLTRLEHPVRSFEESPVRPKSHKSSRSRE